MVNNINMSHVTMPQDIPTKYKDVFEGVGCLPGKYHLQVDASCRPVKCTPRRVAIPLKGELKALIVGPEKIHAADRLDQQ